MNKHYRSLRSLDISRPGRVFLVENVNRSGLPKVLTLFPEHSHMGRGALEELCSHRKGIVHSSLVALREFYLEEGRVDIITDYLSASPLFGKSSRYGLAAAARIGLRLAEILAELHRARFYCGVIKPTKLYISKTGRPIANILLPEVFSSDRESGLVRYGAPEFITEGTSDAKSDLYSLGLVLYRLFTGHPPFGSTDRENLMGFQVLADPIPAEQLKAGIPAPICEMLARLTSKAREARPGTALDVVEVLRSEQGKSRAAPTKPLPLPGSEDGPPVRRESDLRCFRRVVRECRSREAIARKVLETLSKQLDAAGRVYLRRRGGKLETIASSSRPCRRAGLESDLGLGDASGRIRWALRPSPGRETSFDLALDMTRSGITIGSIYLECAGRSVAESRLSLAMTLAREASKALAPLISGSVEVNGSSKPVPTFSTGSNEVNFVAVDDRMRSLYGEVKRLASTRATILISGESGTGKEVIARMLHGLSSRREGPFVPVNCSGIPEHLIETELFGHRRGSFTGAGRDKPGLFEAAHRGTLFLDEIGSMPSEIQARLLRAVEERVIRRLGEIHQRAVDIRIVSASNRPLRSLVRKGLFREDLYHRLNVCPVQIPPLRERPSDIGPLSRHFLSLIGKREGRECSLTAGALRILQEYRFPGNVRELQNLLESCFYRCEGDALGARLISERLESDGAGSRNGESRSRETFNDLTEGAADFWTVVRDPFLRRDLSRRDVRKIISLGLMRTAGSYRGLIRLFNLPDHDYKRLLSFLSHHDCKVDFRPFRGMRPTDWD